MSATLEASSDKTEQEKLLWALWQRTTRSLCNQSARLSGASGFTPAHVERFKQVILKRIVRWHGTSYSRIGPDNTH